MKQMEVSANVPKNEKKGIMEDKSAAVLVNYGETIEESIQLFGAEAMNSNAFANWRVTLQAGLRRGLIAGKTQDQLQADFAAAKMGVATAGGRVDPIQASLARYKSMTSEERKAYLTQLKEAAAE